MARKFSELRDKMSAEARARVDAQVAETLRELGDRCYPVRLSLDDNDTVLVDFPDFPEAHTFGVDRDDALRRAVDALATVVDAYRRDGRALPEPTDQGDEFIPVVVDAQ